VALIYLSLLVVLLIFRKSLLINRIRDAFIKNFLG